PDNDPRLKQGAGHPPVSGPSAARRSRAPSGPGPRYSTGGGESMSLRAAPRPSARRARGAPATPPVPAAPRPESSRGTVSYAPRAARTGGVADAPAASAARTRPLLADARSSNPQDVRY